MSNAHYGTPHTRRGILDAARTLIAESGSAVGLGQIAERAEVSRQAVYLHFGDRTNLLVSLVQYMDDTLDLDESLEWVHAATTSEALIERTMTLHARFSAAIDSVAVVLESAQYEDDALGEAWRDRMRFRHEVHRKIVERIADAGDLTSELTVDAATDLFYAVTMPGPWRELTRELGWTNEQYADAMTGFLRRSLLERPATG